MQIANVKQRQILPRMGKIWACTPQNLAYRGGGSVYLFLGSTINNAAKTDISSKLRCIKTNRIYDNIFGKRCL